MSLLSTGGLPPLVLAVQDPRTPATLVAFRTATGTVGAGLESWPDPVPEAALFTYWPSRPRLPERILAYAARIEARGGAVVPLATVLGRLGVTAPRSLAGLTAVLAPDLDAPEDPAHLGARWVEGLAERLAAGEPALPEGSYRPAPEIQEVLAVLPDAPGVYTFHAADRTVLYVGKARSLLKRVPSHFGPHPAEPEKTRALAHRSAELTWTPAGSELEALVLEHLEIRNRQPVLNRQERAHRRRRGGLRGARRLLVLPAAAPGRVEVCMVAGDGGFHWQGTARKPVVPRSLWSQVRAILDDPRHPGWDPSRPGVRLDPSLAAELGEITLSWLARHGDRVSQIDLERETAGEPLRRRIRALLAEDPADGRIEVAKG